MSYEYNTQHPHIASYVILRKGDKVAFVYRTNTGWMNEFYGLPSGKIETGESFVEGAIREAKEEVGVDIKEVNLSHALTMHRHQSGKAPEWVDIFFEASKWEGEPYNAEPHKHGKLEWLDINNLPDNVIHSVAVSLRAIGEGKKYIELGWHDVG